MELKQLDITPDMRKKVLDRFAPHIYTVKSKSNPDKEYLITLAKNHITCTCRDYLFRSKDSNGNARIHHCKHIKSLILELLRQV